MPQEKSSENDNQEKDKLVKYESYGLPSEGPKKATVWKKKD